MKFLFVMLLSGMLLVSVVSANLLPTEERIASDFDGDDQTEVAMILRNDTGGSSVFYHLLVVDTDSNGELRTISSLIGDNVRFLNFWHDRKETAIALDMVEIGKGDSTCCPTHKTVRRWELKDGKLKELPAEPYGQVNINDLVRLNWRLVQMDDQVIPENMEINMVFGPGQLGGKSGCNRYLADVNEPSPGKLAINVRMTATRMACSEKKMQIEQRFLELMAQATSYRWMGNTMTIGWEDNGKQGSLSFRLVDE
jgi:heat shock protein HslJ